MAVLAVALLAAGGSSAAGRGPVKSLLELRQDKVVVQEWDLSCGAAALATILTYQHNDPVSEREVARGLMRRDEYLAQPELVKMRLGFSLLDLKRYVDQRGYEGVAYGQLTFEDLIAFAPILTPINLHGFNHFVVFRGSYGNRVLLSDPSYGNTTMTHEQFKRLWASYPELGKVGFVVERRDGRMPPNRLLPRASDFVLLQ